MRCVEELSEEHRRAIWSNLESGLCASIDSLCAQAASLQMNQQMFCRQIAGFMFGHMARIKELNAAGECDVEFGRTNEPVGSSPDTPYLNIRFDVSFELKYAMIGIMQSL